MKKIILATTMLATSITLAGCVTDKNLTHTQQCAQFERQIAMLKEPNSGYSWKLAQYKINQIEHQAEQSKCKA